MHVGIIAALAAEAGAFKAPRGSFAGDHSYTLAVSGPGADNAERIARALLANGCTALISWGVAGSLTRELHSGEIVFSDQICDPHDQLLESGGSLLAAIERHADSQVDFCVGRLLSVNAPVNSSAEKARLGLDHHALAVDMESRAIAAVAQTQAVPFASVRAIVDEIDFEIPTIASAGMNSDGSLNIVRTVRSLARRPSELPALLRLARHFNRALASLRNAATVLTR